MSPFRNGTTLLRPSLQNFTRSRRATGATISEPELVAWLFDPTSFGRSARTRRAKPRVNLPPWHWRHYARRLASFGVLVRRAGIGARCRGRNPFSRCRPRGVHLSARRVGWRNSKAGSLKNLSWNCFSSRSQLAASVARHWRYEKRARPWANIAEMGRYSCFPWRDPNQLAVYGWSPLKRLRRCPAKHRSASARKRRRPRARRLRCDQSSAANTGASV